MAGGSGPSRSHAGLFRKPEVPKRGKKRRRKAVAAAAGEVALGSLSDLREASKGGIDPSGTWCILSTCAFGAETSFQC